MSTSKNARGGSIVLPLILIAAGLLVLAGNLGWMDWSTLWSIVELWPVLLIAVGVDLLTQGRYRLIVAIVTVAVVALALMGRLPFLSTSTGPAPEVHDVHVPLDAAEHAEIDIRVGVSELRLSSQSDSDTLVSGTVRTGRGESFRMNTRLDGETKVVTLRSEQQGISTGPSGGRGWNLSLAPRVPLDLTISTGVGRGQFDLEDLVISDLEVDAGVGETIANLPPPRDGSYEASFETGVGATTVRVPANAAVRVEIDKGLGSVTVRGGFDALGDDVYETPGFEDADERIEIQIDGGVGAITIEAER